MAHPRVLVIGAGMVGVHHALAAALADHPVVLVDSHHTPRGASYRNLGAIRISGRHPGGPLELAQYGNNRWAAIAARVPDVGYQRSGSVTLLHDEAELKVAEEYCEMYGDRIALDIVDDTLIHQVEPSITGTYRGALLCHDDAFIRPFEAVPALVTYLEHAEGVDIRLGTRIKSLEQTGGELVAHCSHGPPIHADVAFVCTGDALDSLFRDHLDEAPLTKVRLHSFEVAQTGPHPSMLVTDGSAFRVYPGFTELESARTLDRLEPAGVESIQWIVASSPDGSLLVGATAEVEQGHASNMPLEGSNWLARRTIRAFGRGAGSVIRRWSATVVDIDRSAQSDPYVALEPVPNVFLITGLGLLGNTLGPAIARQSIARISPDARDPLDQPPPPPPPRLRRYHRS
ncbi:MAG: FAD-binding oxidoreductase, partial [Acidimicrobiia bacterium]|nr:FAD-binding oxidoreductase [Acidimicrobiia bacterium]